MRARSSISAFGRFGGIEAIAGARAAFSLSSSIVLFGTEVLISVSSAVPLVSRIDFDAKRTLFLTCSVGFLVNRVAVQPSNRVPLGTMTILERSSPVFDANSPVLHASSRVFVVSSLVPRASNIAVRRSSHRSLRSKTRSLRCSVLVRRTSVVSLWRSVFLRPSSLLLPRGTRLLGRKTTLLR
jgi:hypothetical protein